MINLHVSFQWYGYGVEFLKPANTHFFSFSLGKWKIVSGEQKIIFRQIQEHSFLMTFLSISF